jgi:hypothetical protein
LKERVTGREKVFLEEKKSLLSNLHTNHANQMRISCGGGWVRCGRLGVVEKAVKTQKEVDV